MLLIHVGEKGEAKFRVEEGLTLAPMWTSPMDTAALRQGSCCQRALTKAPEWLVQDDGRFADIQDVARGSSTNQNIIDRSILVTETRGNSLRHASIQHAERY